MAIDTTNEKFALLSFGNTLMPQVLVSPSTLGQDDQQHLLWGYPGILWSVAAAIAFVLDLNSRLMAYFRDQYSVSEGDLTTLTARNLSGRSGDMNARLHKAISDATEAMS